MTDAEARGITTMRAFDDGAVFAEPALHIVRADQRRIAEAAFGEAGEFRRGRILEAERRMRLGRSREASPVVMIDTRRAALDNDWKLSRAQLERKTPCMRGGADGRDRGRTDIGDQLGAAALDPRITGVWRRAEGRGLDIVIGEHGGERVRGRGAATIEARETPAAETEEPQHRHGSVDRVGHLCRRQPVARDEALPERQEIEQEVNQGRWVPRDMPAIGENLPLKLLVERARIAVDYGLVLGDAEPAIDQGHQRDEARHAVRRVTIARREIAELLGQRLQEQLIGARVARTENDDRVRKPGDDPARHDLRLPTDAARISIELDPIRNQSLGLLARQFASCYPPMPEPGEAVQFFCPRLGGWCDLERRLRADFRQPPRQAEMAIVKFRRAD